MTTIQASCIKYHPLNNYQWDRLPSRQLDAFLPLLSGLKKLFNTLAPLAPFLPIKLGQGTNCILTSLEFMEDPSWKLVFRISELVGNYFDPKLGLCLHTGNAFVDNLQNFSSNKLERSARILSNVLTLAPLLKLSKRDALIASLSQALLQASLRFYDSYKLSQEIKNDTLNIIPAASHAIIGALELQMAYQNFQTIYKLQKMVEQTFILRN